MVHEKHTILHIGKTSINGFKHLVVPKHLVVHHFPHQNGNFGYDQKTEPRIMLLHHISH